MINDNKVSALLNILQMELDNLNRARRPRNVWEVVRDRWWPYRGLGVSLFSLLRRWYLSRSALGDDHRDMLMGVIERLGGNVSAGYVPKRDTAVDKLEDDFQKLAAKICELALKPVTANKKPKCASRGKRKK